MVQAVIFDVCAKMSVNAALKDISNDLNPRKDLKKNSNVTSTMPLLTATI